jgi:hypothetical protein
MPYAARDGIASGIQSIPVIHGCAARTRRSPIARALTQEHVERRLTP